MPTAGGTESPIFCSGGRVLDHRPVNPVPCTDIHAFPAMSNASYCGVRRSVPVGGPVITNVAVSESVPLARPSRPGGCASRTPMASPGNHRPPPRCGDGRNEPDEIPRPVGPRPRTCPASRAWCSRGSATWIDAIAARQRPPRRASATIGMPVTARARCEIARLSFITLPIHIGLTIVGCAIVCTIARTRAKAGRSTQCRCMDDGTRYTGGIINCWARTAATLKTS